MAAQERLENRLVVPGRHARPSDFLVDAAALCAGIVIAGVLERLRR
jgi:hypothetical protein